MNYDADAVQRLFNSENPKSLEYIQNNPGTIQPEQLQQIIQNSLKGNLNTNDIK